MAYYYAEKPALILSGKLATTKEGATLTGMGKTRGENRPPLFVCVPIGPNQFAYWVIQPKYSIQGVKFHLLRKHWFFSL